MRPLAIEDEIHELAIDGYLKSLKMPGALREYRTLVREARERGMDALELLEALLSREADNRRAHQRHSRRSPVTLALDFLRRIRSRASCAGDQLERNQRSVCTVFSDRFRS